jgi:16S rRNA G966 N2-methylase RsmD
MNTITIVLYVIVVLLLLSLSTCISPVGKIALFVVATTGVVGEQILMEPKKGAAVYVGGATARAAKPKSVAKLKSAAKPKSVAKPKSAAKDDKPTENVNVYKKINLDKFDDDKIINLDGVDEDIKTIRDWFPDFIEDKNKLQITKESIFSLSRKDAAEKTTQDIKHVFGDEDISNLTITDATANVGGNTLNFAKNFKNVNAVEINPVNHEALDNNVKVSGFKNVNVINDDYVKVMNDIKQDVIFFDPPWGGPGYWKEKAITLELSGKPLYDVINDIKEKPKLIIIKAPKNFAIMEFKKNVDSDHVYDRSFFNHKKVFVRYGTGERPVKPAKQVPSDDLD